MRWSVESGGRRLMKKTARKDFPGGVVGAV